MQYFLGKPLDYWYTVAEVYEELQPLLKTKAGKQLVLLAKLELAQQELEKCTETVKLIKQQLDDFEIVE